MVKKKFKTSEKVQKFRDLEGPTSFRPFENTLYTVSRDHGVYREHLIVSLHHMSSLRVDRNTPFLTRMETSVLSVGCSVSHPEAIITD